MDKLNKNTVRNGASLKDKEGTKWEIRQMFYADDALLFAEWRSAPSSPPVVEPKDRRDREREWDRNGFSVSGPKGRHRRGMCNGGRVIAPHNYCKSQTVPLEEECACYIHLRNAHEGTMFG